MAASMQADVMLKRELRVLPLDPRQQEVRVTMSMAWASENSKSPPMTSFSNKATPLQSAIHSL